MRAMAISLFLIGCGNETAVVHDDPNDPIPPPHLFDVSEMPGDPQVPEDLSGDAVQIVVLTESLCPCAAQWTHDLVNWVLPEVERITVVNRYLDGTARDDGTVGVFHGAPELLSQKHEACVQDRVEQAGGDGHLTSLRWTECVNGPCTGPGGFLNLEYCELQGDVGRESGVPQAMTCAAELGLDWEDIDACANSAEGLDLHWQSSKIANDAGAVYAMWGLPVRWVEGERTSDFWDCNSFQSQGQDLIDQICDAYTGEQLVEACL